MDEEKAKKVVEQILEQIEQNQGKQKKQNSDEPVVRCIVVDMGELRQQKERKAGANPLNADFAKTLRADASKKKEYSIVDIIDAIEHFSNADNVLEFLRETEFPAMNEVSQLLDAQTGEAMMFFSSVFMYSMLAWLKQNK